MRKDTIKLIKGLSKEQLIEFIIDYAKQDDKIINAINICFDTFEHKSELIKIEKKIDKALNGISDWDNHDSWGHAIFNTNDITHEIYKRISQGHIRLAFDEIALLYCKLLENFEYQGECEIADEAEKCIDIMNEIADKAIISEDKDYIFKKCIELAELEDGEDYGADYKAALLNISAKFVTNDNLSELEPILAGYEASHRRTAPFKLIRLGIIKRLQGDRLADKFIADNLEFEVIREIAYDKAIKNGDFEQGAKLCIDAIPMYKYHFSISPWWNGLYNIYEMTADKAKMIQTAKEILLQGDLKYYDILKSLLIEQNLWDSSYKELLKEFKEKMQYKKYMVILEKEYEYDLLLEQVKANLEQIYNYGKFLAEKYPVDICSLFVTRLENEAINARNRKEYKKVCSNILVFAKSGYKKESKEMINNFKIKYKTKPAFIDELQKILTA